MKATRIKFDKAVRRVERGEGSPSDYRRAGVDMPQPIARMADCPEHGLHGEREACFDCGREVDHPIYVALRWVLIVLVVTAALAFAAGWLA